MINFKSPIAVFIFLWMVVSGLTANAQSDTAQHTSDRKNALAQQNKPYVILISADGFRWDYAKKYQANNLLDLSKNGVRANSMIPSFPSVTFPNHYSLVTGLYPSHHGLVNNSFLDEKTNERYSMGAKNKVRDGKWYGGTPLWVLAEQQQMNAASMFWVGSEAEIKGLRPSFYYDYNEKIPVAQRIAKVKEWLMMPEDKRPHLITFYLSEPDHAGHSFGPNSEQADHAVKEVDSIIFELTKAVQSTKLPVNYIFVSDHGMTPVDRENPLPTPKMIDTAKYIIASSGTMMDIHAKNKADVKPLYEQLKREEKDYTAYLKSEMPEHLHYSASDDKMNRIGDILLIPTWPKVFSSRKPGAGYHGFDPTVVKDMHATFMAWGPAFKNNLEIPSFENVNIYPLIANILGLTYQEQIDGKFEVLQSILKNN
ncbi:ectonucleotide pyrophosphatase/phosphodiesterase [Pedobacter lithocola]|uniref:Ectonucleotide pyrophosphatase/phosphodiesterase n=1 Tax=Pedobacter lithocola TaxID=1908239 RepID=A0ABV8PCL4_9SPHI